MPGSTRPRAPAVDPSGGEPVSTRAAQIADQTDELDPASGAVRAVPRHLPRGVGGLPQDVVVLSQRARLVEGTAHAVADKGYAAATVADIISHAGVSRTTFYQLFRDKEDCFLACFEGLAKAQLAVITDALSAGNDLPNDLIAALRAYLSRIDADGWYARAFIAEAQAATPRVRQAFDAAGKRLERALRDWFERVRAAYPDVPACADSTHRMLQAGLEGHVIASIRGGERALAAQANLMAALVFAAFGLYGWAEAARSGRDPTGGPREWSGVGATGRLPAVGETR